MTNRRKKSKTPVKAVENKSVTVKKWNKALINLGLVLFSSLLFALSFPNPVFNYGLSFLAWVAYVPALIVVHRCKILASMGYGALFGFTSYFLFNYWLSNFHPLAGIIVYGIYMVFMAIVFLLLKAACIYFPKCAFLVQWIIWLAYEYICTLGFLGYPYGVTGYSQWQIIPLIQIASLTGIWGVSALVTFPSFWLAAAIKKENKEILPRTNTNQNEQERDKDNKFVWLVVKIKENFFAKKVSGIIWLAVFAATLVFGFINIKDYSHYPTAQIALIQHNTDPWEASRAPAAFQKIESYRKDLVNLIRLSDEALASHPKPQMVVWPETSFIPRIHWHNTYREIESQAISNIVRDLLNYLSLQDVPFVIGNNDAQKEPAKNPNEDEKYRVDYNAVLLYENGINTESYRKMHLVPFTEHFPYRKLFPFVYNALINADTHFWEKGETETVFKGPGFTFSAPICFEDSFGYLSRTFVRKGADVLVNLSNDAWAKSISAQNQHLAMAVFRAVENNRPMVRSTTSGQTCAIDPNGRIIAQAPPFTETWLNVSIPLVTGSGFTIYTLFGDYLGIFFVLAAVILLLLRALWCTIRP